MAAKFKVGISGLRMGESWAQAVMNNPDCELSAVYDAFYKENTSINYRFFENSGAAIVDSYAALLALKPDIVIVASPDHFHVEQSIQAMEAGCDVICEKPLTPTVAQCRELIAAVQRTGRKFMTGQVCRFAPGFALAKALVEEGRIGRIACIETEYAHNYGLGSEGFQAWRKSAAVGRENVLGGGCHAMDLLRWLAGEPESVYAVGNHLLMPDWATTDSCYAVLKFASGAIGKLFASCGTNAPYTMRTVIHGTEGTIVCDNTSDHISLCEKKLQKIAGTMAFARIPVGIKSHNVANELTDFVARLKDGAPIATDVFEGSRTVALGEAILTSIRTGLPEKPATF